MHWTWNYPWSPFLTWSVVAFAGALFLGSYALIRRELGSKFSTLTILLFRAAGFALLVFLLLQPSVFLTRTDDIPPPVAVLIDTTASMGVTDKGNKESRLRESLSIIREEKLIRWLEEHSQPRIFEMTSGITEIETKKLSSGLDAKGMATSLGLAFRHVKEEYKAGDLAAVFLFSDGRDNAGIDPAESAKHLGAPVYAVGLGRKRAPNEKVEEKDLAVARAAHDSRVIVGHTTDITVTINMKGYDARSVPVELALDDKVISRSAVSLSPDRPEREITLKLIPEEPGQFVYVVRVPAEPEEKNKGNNEKPIPIYVTDPVARVLYVEERPRWDFKYLSRVLSDYKNIRHTAVVRMGPDKSTVQGSDPTEAATLATMEPAQILRLKAFIIGDVPKSFFSPDQLTTIATFVEQGGALLLLSGRKCFGAEGFAGSPLAQLLPFELTGEANYSETPFSVSLTPDGRAHPAFQSVQHDWASAPQLISLLRVGALRPGATALMKAEDGSDSPVVVAQRYGKGKVGVVLTDSTWRWKLGMADGVVQTDYHALFWRQIIDWLMPDQKAEKETRAVQLIADKLHYELNEMVNLTVTALDTDGSLAKQAEVECRIFTPDGKVVKKSAIFGKIGGAGGVQAEGFLASFPTHVSGKFKVVATATHEGRNLGRDEVSFAVGDTSVEMAETDPDHDLLRAVAKATSGKFYEPGTVAQMRKDFNVKPKKNTWTEKREIWNEWWVFLCFIGLVTAEWAVRKWRQLE